MWVFFYFKCIRIDNKASGILRIMNVNTVNIHITNKNNDSVNPLKRLSLNCIHIERSLFAKENHIYDIFKVLFKEQIGHHLGGKIH